MSSRKKDRKPRRLFKKARSHPWAIPIRHGPTSEMLGAESMSDVLRDFIKPYEDGIETETGLKKLLTLAVLAWNAALLPEDQRDAPVEDCLNAGFSKSSEADRAEAKKFIDMMIRRKEMHFSEIRRAIISFQVTDAGERWNLTVSSML